MNAFSSFIPLLYQSKDRTTYIKGNYLVLFLRSSSHQRRTQLHKFSCQYILKFNSSPIQNVFLVQPNLNPLILLYS